MTEFRELGKTDYSDSRADNKRSMIKQDVLQIVMCCYARTRIGVVITGSLNFEPRMPRQKRF